jgi:hypothetical protein
MRIGIATSELHMSHRKFERNARRTYHRFVFWWLKALLFSMPSQDFACDGVIVPEIPVLDVLL